ncbi:MAG: hypothetical protein GX882_08810, partial [Methanomicrobiales archaeon]|nr:hypothetical protein [Methanomicrobiales archaeon]
LKDYESAERDLANYEKLSRQFDRLVVTLDVSGTDIGEFQKNNRQNQEALKTLLNDSRRFDDLKRIEIQVRDDEEQHMTIVYEGEALRQKMREGFSTYAKREAATIQIAEHYEIDATAYQESIGHISEIAGASDEWQEKINGGPIRSPLVIAVTPGEGRYGDTLQITGTHAGGKPGAPVDIYVDSRLEATVTLGDDHTCSHPYRVGRVLAGPHLAYAVAGSTYSEVATFEILTTDTAITLALAEVNGTAVACTGNLTTGNRSVALAPILIRVSDGTIATAETDRNGTYKKEITLPAGEHTLRAEFHAAGYPLNASESAEETIHLRGEGLSPLPFVAALAALIGSGWYLRRRASRQEEYTDPSHEPGIEPEEEAREEAVSIEGLPPREAATALFHALRARLDIAETKTPRDCAKIAPAYSRFFERYEMIRYAGETPTDEELRWMEKVARGEDEHEA